MYISQSDLLGIPKIRDFEDLAFNVKLSKRLLYTLVRFPENFYVKVDIPKKSGGIRTLYCPSIKMKVMQAWILRNILEKIDINSAATAFRKKHNVKDNVKLHKDNKYILCLDIENFFDTISYYNVYNVFEAIGYNKNVAQTLANICTNKGALPQGGVTSPALSK